MAEAVEPQRQSIQDRIASLNVGHVGRAPITATANRRPPPPKPPLERSNSASIPTNGTTTRDIGNEPTEQNQPAGKTVLPPPEGIVRTGQQINGKAKPPPPPRVPPRNASSSSKPSPALPPRRPSEQSNRRDSQESISSTISSVSGLSNGTTTTSNLTRTQSIDTGRIRAPVFDPANLPPLPPKRTQQEKDAALKQSYKSRQPSFFKGASKTPTEVTAPLRPPSLPQRSKSGDDVPALEPMTPSEPPCQPPRRLPPTTIPPVSPRSAPPPIPSNRPKPSHGLFTPDTTPEPNPPPIPSSTRPDLAKIMATKPQMAPASSTVRPRPVTAQLSSNSCLICRDFSAVDAHAARFPRQQVASLAWLASQLCDPFPSHTDKARAIFTWEHHNIAYNVHDFFNNSVKHTTPVDTLESGLAVCEGYASLFAALAAKAGLECIVVAGHGKGISHRPLEPHDSCPPPDFSGHAWNAVRIDGGEWKLVDACWGAGSVCSNDRKYTPHFKPEEFTKSNEEFGLLHYSKDPKHLFRADGRAPSWEEYIRGPNQGILPPQVYSMLSDEGFKGSSLLPAARRIYSNPAMHNGPTVRFQMERVCPHWDPRKNGKGLDYVYVIDCKAPDGKADFVPFENNGRYWWADVAVEKLGPPGTKVQICAMKTMGGLDGRGLSVEEFRRKINRTGWSGSYLAYWEMV